MKKVLVIDDEDIIRISCERTLVPQGYNVVTTSSGGEGLELLEKECFPLILLDLKMPDMDGIEVLMEIKKRCLDTKVIMITGYSTVEIAVKALKLGAFNYIEKPFSPDILLDAVREAFGET